MSETDYGSRLPGQLQLRQVGKVGRTVPCHVQEFGRPGQLALWQMGKAGKPLHDQSIADPVRVVDFSRVNLRPGLHRGYVPGTVMSGSGHRLPGQLALLAGGHSNCGRSSRETLA